MYYVAQTFATNNDRRRPFFATTVCVIEKYQLTLRINDGLAILRYPFDFLVAGQDDPAFLSASLNPFCVLGILQVEVVVVDNLDADTFQ